MPRLTRRRVLAAAAASVGACGLYTWRVEPHWLQVAHHRMPVRNLPQELVGATLLHASDLHIGPQVDDAWLDRVFAVMAELSPKIVVYTGDFVSVDTDLRDHAPRMMSRLVRGTLGTFGVLGNHDYRSGWTDEATARQVVTLAEQAGVRILRNELADVNGLTIAGMDDLWSHRFRPDAVLPRLNPDGASIALVHNPDAVDAPGWDGYSGWILAGHTHGGQCKPPFLPPPLLPVRNRRYTSGEFTLSGDRRLYISRGVGHLLRVRFNSRPELTVFELTPDDGTPCESFG